MRIALLFLFIICGIAITSTAQYQFDYQKNYSTSGPSCEGEDLAELPGGNVIVAATRSVHISGGVFQANVLLMKLRPNGDTVWTREFGSATAREYAESMSLLPDGRIVIAGYITDLPSSTADVLVMLADTNGSLIWEKRIGGPADEFANTVKQTASGFIVGGVNYGSLVNGADAWLLKLSPAGDSLWSKTFGGPLYDDCWDICLTPDNGYLMTGGNYSFAAGSFDDAWMIKTDSMGNQHWMKHYGLANRVDWSWAVTPFTENGIVKGYVFTGIKDSEEDPPGVAYGSLHFVKVDTGGNVIWDKSITQSGGYRLEGRDVKQTPDGGFLICGYRLSPSANGPMFYVARTDSAGNKLWDTSYINGMEAYVLKNIIPTSDGGFMVTGSIETPTPTQYIMVTRFTGTTNSIKEPGKIVSVAIAPNPTSGTFLLTADTKGTGQAHVTVTDVSGRIVHSEQVSTSGGKLSKRIMLDGNVTAGPYAVTIVAGQERITTTILIN